MDLNVRAEALVSVSKINAVSMLPVLRKELTVLDNVDSDHWDFIVTVAGVYAAIGGISTMQLTEEELAPIIETIQIRFLEWNPEAGSTYEDCKAMVARTHEDLTASGKDGTRLLPVVIGLWIMEKVLGRHTQSDEERELAQRVGSMVMGAMSGHFSQ